MMYRTFKQLRADRKGSTLLEFAFVTPPLMMLLMGSIDLGYRALIESTLQNAVQKAARDATLESGNSGGALAAIDGKVVSLVKPVVDNASFTFSRKNYTSFTNAGSAEPFTDLNGNGLCDPGEPYQDSNDNNTRDSSANAGANGQGGARDITVYTATVAYQRMTPVYGLFGWSPIQTVSSTAVLRNQPYGQQANRPTRNCT